MKTTELSACKIVGRTRFRAGFSFLLNFRSWPSTAVSSIEFSAHSVTAMKFQAVAQMTRF